MPTENIISLDDNTLARAYAPLIACDAREPFVPTLTGYTVFRASAPSPSFPRIVPVDWPISMAIEYALWWDWDIQHLYELEHVWVFVDVQGTVARVESSQHGAATAGDLHLKDGRPLLYAEPGKHALTTRPEELLARQDSTARACSSLAGVGGVWVTPLYRGRITTAPDADQLARTYLRQHAFVPDWEWSQIVDLADLPCVAWPVLDAAIPTLVAHQLAELAARIPRAERHVWRIGHRGAPAHAPENTLASISAAAGLGANLVELDVRMSADNVAVLSHDAHITVNDTPVPISSLPAHDLAQSGPTPEVAVPTLADALARCAQLGLGLYLELKEARAAPAVVAQLISAGMARYSIVGAFNPDWVAQVTDMAPQIATSILFGDTAGDAVDRARGCGARYVHPCWERHAAPHTLLTEAWLARVRQAGLGVICWHEERPVVLHALLQLGVSGICTDRLDVLAECMR